MEIYMNTALMESLRNCFQKEYGKSEPNVFFAPGRVNLIGEHTDYNGGHVFPCALSVGTYGMISPREDDRIRMYSLNLADAGVTEVSLKELSPGRTDGWTGYPEGVFWSLMERGYEFSHGVDLMFAGDVPAGSGLSSSASIEVLTGLMIRELYGFLDLTGIDLALVGQEAENRYCGMHCGIMDQFSSAMGKEEHAIFLDTETLDYRLVPLHLGDYELLIINSHVKHSLVSSAYNDRRKECARALDELKTIRAEEDPSWKEPDHLCELTPEQFLQHQMVIRDPVVRRRAKHAVFENHRTIQAVRALQEDDIVSFGRLMNESHDSLRDDYEVSCEEIDYLVEVTRGVSGVAGSRITGGGFGGCTVTVVKKDQVEQLIEEVGQKYLEKFDTEASFYRVKPEDGAHVIIM